MSNLLSARRRTASARRLLFSAAVIFCLLFQQSLTVVSSAQRARKQKAAAPALFLVSTTLVINEIDYDQVGSDTAEFLELKNVSAGAINLDNYTVELVNAAATGGPAAYDTIDLPNVNLAAGDYYVICANAATVPNCDLDDGPDTDFIQNGSPDAVALRLSGTIVDTVSYEGNTAGFTETTGTPNNATGADSNTVAFIGLSRLPDGTDTDNNSADLTIRCITPGATNASATTGCTAPPTIPNLTINDVTADETNAGTTTFTFTVSLSAPAGPGGVTFDIATTDGTAQDGNPAGEDNDYVARSLTGQTIPSGSSTYTFDVTVNGDTTPEPSETFFVNVTNVTGAAVTDGQGQGTITNDDSPNLAINDVSQDEGNGGGTTAFTFTVSLSTATHGGVTFDICTADGTAQDGNPAGEDTDYAANCLTGQTIPNGSQSYQFTVNVNADSTVEPNETFFVNVTNVTGANVTDGQGQGTIVNDDFVITPIHTIQGSGTSSPLVGQVVTTTGIVTLLKTGSNAGAGAANGFFLQTPNADSDPSTSEGIFVFTSTPPAVAVGDEIRVTGTVIEFNGLTEIGSVTNITLIDTGNTLPDAVTLDSTILSPTAAPTQPQLEKYEGMRLTAASLKTVAPNDNFFDVYTVLSSVPRPMREPGIPVSDAVPPDPTTGTPDCCIPRWDENPERLKLDTNGRAGAPNTPYTSNVTFTSVSGPLDFGFNEYRLIPDAAPAASANMTAVPVPTPLASEFTVASYNIENFNNGSATQREKAALTVRTVLHYPDVIGLVEIDDLVHLQALRDEINNDAVAAGDPNPQYEAYLSEGNVETGDQNQNVAFLVKTSRVSVTSVTQERKDENYTPPGGATTFLHDRPPLVLDAVVEPTGANPRRVIVVVNHLRSFIGVDLVAGDGPRVREKRKKQAESLADLLNDLQTANPGVPVISVGDYNAYQFSSGYDDSISVIKGNPTPDDQIVVDQSPDLVEPNFFNLIDELPVAERYSFIFEGTPQALDHHLVNTAARARNTRTAIARVNADFPENPASAYASNVARPERNSDHDPVVSYYSLGSAQAAGSLIISEFRFRGPNTSGPMTPSLAPDNEFVELYNNTDADITVSTTDGSAGWAIVASDGTTLLTIPNGTVIPARGHWLGVNANGYSLHDYGGTGAADGDDGWIGSTIPDNGGVAVFRTSNPALYTTDTRLDAAGYTTAPALYREGAGLPTGGPEFDEDVAEWSFFRDFKAPGGRPIDTGNNATDFLGASTDGAGTGLGQRLGAPGPENLSSPIERNGFMPLLLLDSTKPAASPPNRVRDFESDPMNNATHGTLTIRRRIRNDTGQNVTALRFRIVNITTFPPATPSTADLRALTSSDVVLSGIMDAATCTETGDGPPPCTATVKGTVLEEPPAQPNGGGWNSSLRVPVSIPDGESVNVQFVLGIQQTGAFKFYINVETLTEAVGITTAPAPTALSRSANRKAAPRGRSFVGPRARARGPTFRSCAAGRNVVFNSAFTQA